MDGLLQFGQQGFEGFSLGHRTGKPIQAVVLLELDDAVLIERLLARGRADDNEAVIRNRLEVYREKTSPLIRFYSDKGLLVSVPAQGTVEEITKRIESVLS